MARLVVELTNRCNLACRHCFEERHAGVGDLPFSIIDRVIREGRLNGIDHVSFTGGEPTLHRRFADIVRELCNAGYTFSFVSNGSTFDRIYRLLEAQGRAFRGVTFSMDGATEPTHDTLRGAGSYRQVMRAVSICAVRSLPFTFNMVLTLENRHETGRMAAIAARLGARGVRFGHFMPESGQPAPQLELSLPQRREVEAEIWRLQDSSRIPIGMAAGYYSDAPFFPCGPLELQEFNINYKGDLTLCCHLSGQRRRPPFTDFAGNLEWMTFAEARRNFEEIVRAYRADKMRVVDRGEFSERDHFPCLYCVSYMNTLAGAAQKQD